VGLIILVVLGGSVIVANALADRGQNDAAVADATATRDTPAAPSATGEESPSATTDDGGEDSGAPSPASNETPTPDTPPTPTPPDPASLTTAKDVAETYAEVWSSGAYDQLYELLSDTAKAAITKDDFVARYEAIAIEAGILELEADIVSGEDDDLLFPMRVTIDSARIGEFTDDNQLPVIKQGDAYRIDWTPSLIFSGLGDGYVRWTSDIPQRGRILDRKGRPLAETGFISKVGVIPGQITDEPALLRTLSDLIDMPEDQIKAAYAAGEPNWFMPIKDYPDQMDPELVNKLGQIPGVVVQKWPARIYPAGSAAAHVVGYMSEITGDEIPELVKQGYEAGDQIGRAGVEAYAESWLAGKRGGVLALVNRDETTIRVLGEVQAEPAMDVILTIDLELQIAADASLGDRVGSAVVMDPANGQILAMASRPTFDPNAFVLGLSDEEWAKLNDPNLRPLVNRATTELYPSGSVFKLVTASAGMVHLGYTADTVLSCPGTFSLEGADQVWADWVPGGQGDMSLHRAIYRSCNTVFYKMGADLDEIDENLLPDMARAFGFGERTGIEELYDLPGTVPDPAWKEEVVGGFWARGDAVNLAIGQGYFTTTPLQMVKAYAAVTNGGTLWKPYLVLDVVRIDGSIAYSGQPEEMGQLPLNQEQIATLQNGMYDVVHASDGTAVAAFGDAPYDVSGKTGSAETGQPEEQEVHGWFGAYAPSDAPRVTIVTMIEYGVTGSGSAAPVARQILDRYFELYP
jgi:penicillin-binding protein 2